jgi:hypothetical protein
MDRAGTAPVCFSLSSIHHHGMHAAIQRAKRTDHAAHHGLRPYGPAILYAPGLVVNAGSIG